MSLLVATTNDLLNEAVQRKSRTAPVDTLSKGVQSGGK